MIDSLKVVGSLKMILSDKDGNIKEERDLKNLVVDTGKAFIINALKASSTSPFNWIAIGTDSTYQNTSNTQLGAEIARVATTNTTTTSSITYTAVFAPGVGTGTIVESGIFNSSSSGTMFSRTTFTSVSKQASDQLTVIWTINIS